MSTFTRFEPPKPKSTFPIHVLKGRDSFDRPCYWFVMCPHERIRRFLSRDIGVERDIAEIGIIVASGLGAMVSYYVRDKLAREYGCDADALFAAAQPI